METIFIPLNPYQTGAPSPNRRMSNILRQYEEFQTKHSDAVILFKCTNIYKTFNVSAKVCAKVLGVELKSYDKDNWYVEFLYKERYRKNARKCNYQ